MLIGLLLTTPALFAGERLPYSLESALAPHDLSGTFPATFGDLSGTITVATDVKGRLAGTIAVSGAEYAASGKVKFRARGSKLSLRGRSANGSVKLLGALHGRAFTGTAKGRGAAARLSGAFAIDVSAAGPLEASFDFELEVIRNRKLVGDGRATASGEPIEIRASGRIGHRLKLRLKARGLRWSGAGGAIPGGFRVSWKAKGFGAKSSGDALELPILAPPLGLAYPDSPFKREAEVVVPPASPTIAGGAVDRYEVSPPLPVGLVLDARTGVLTGAARAPARKSRYKVTATNAAGRCRTRIRVSVRGNRAYSLARQKGPFSDDDLRHFLVRTQWAARPADLEELRKKGVAAVTKRMLAPPEQSAVEAQADALLVNDEDPPGLEGGFPSEDQLARWWLHLMTRTEHPFQEVLAFHWHDHFATSSTVLTAERLYWMKDHVNLWRRHGAGNLRELLVGMSRDWAMIRWLDGETSTRNAPNENFAREFWELFTLGVDNGYTQEDILEAARAFTGYRSRLDEETGQRRIEFDPDRHDPGDKVIFGKTIPGQNVRDDYESVVDLTLAERPVAEYIAKKLLARFCYEEPPAGIVAELASILRENDYELEPVLRTIFRSEAFFSARSREGSVKGPVEFAVGFIRATGLHISIAELDRRLTEQGQRPTQPPTVNGWPTGTRWLSAQDMVERANLVDYCVTQSEAGVRAADLLPPDARTPGAVVDALAATLGVELSAEDRADCVSHLSTERRPDGSVVHSPFDPADEVSVEARVRGLLYVLAQHPTHHRR
jgi:uncharacterized protein (DUF1800 family)